MALVGLDRVTLSYDGEILVRDVSLQVKRGDRLVLIGRNGTGKTSLLEIIQGIKKPDSGTVSLEKGLKIGVLAQIPNLGDAPSLLDAMVSGRSELIALRERISELQNEAETGNPAIIASLGQLQDRYEREGGDDLERRAYVALQNVGFDPGQFDQSTTMLSGGERSRLMLARILLQDPDLLLLDEPTNHLDIAGTEFLEQYLASFKGGAVVVTHDRAFVDHFATAIAALEPDKTLHSYPGSYDRYLQLREENRLRAQKDFDQQQEYIERSEEFIRRTHAGQKNRQAKSRQKALDKLEHQKAPTTESDVMGLYFQETEHSGKIVFQVKDLSLRPGSQTLLQKASFHIQRGERVGIIGPNGCGKTTLLNTLAGNLSPENGKIQTGYRTLIGFFDQALSALTTGKTVLQELSSCRPELPEQNLRDLAGRFLFHGDDVFRNVESFSGGEQSRLALALLVMGTHNVLLLDEPTNHLDIPSREILEESLQHYPGTVIVVSHDRFFLDRVAKRILSFENRELVDQLGMFSELRANRRIMVEIAQSAATIDPEKQRKREEFEQRRKGLRAQESTEKRIQELEQLIHSQEQEIEQFMQEMADPKKALDWEFLEEIQDKKRAKEKEHEETMREWEQLQSESGEPKKAKTSS